MWHSALILLRDRPHCLSADSFAAHRKSASVSPAAISTRAQMLRAAAAETCWPVTARQEGGDAFVLTLREPDRRGGDMRPQFRRHGAGNGDQPAMQFRVH